ncbi:MAG: regulatory protein RecX [Eggerthellaceae bacterium]
MAFNTSGQERVSRSVSSFDPDEGCSRSRRKRNHQSRQGISTGNSRKGRLSRFSGDGDSTASEKEKKPVFSALVHLCSVRDRSCAEINERLLKDGYSDLEVQAALERATECGLVDDARFADCFVRTKAAAGKGRVWIQRELSVKHGFDVESLEGWPHEYGLSESDQLESAITFLQTHPPRAKDLYSSAYRKLAQRGYPASVAREAARSWMKDAGIWG